MSDGLQRQVKQWLAVSGHLIGTTGERGNVPEGRGDLRGGGSRCYCFHDFMAFARTIALKYCP